ncbi:hypothetical protein WJX72_006155 [[Myrmecia] bisecta]|uniref:Kinesin-like protein n=1 Tax=[Myrmecia] bisecta TaxID=41462 RepID=A0AAW1QFU6_9CHLO
MEDVFSTPPEAASAAVTPGTTPRAVDWIREAELSELVASKQREQQEARQQAEQTIAQLEQALLDKQKGEEEEAALAAQLEERLAEITARDQQIQELLAREDQLRQRTEELASETQAAKSVLLTAVKPEGKDAGKDALLARLVLGIRSHMLTEESGADSLVEVASEVAALHESLQGRYLEEAAQRRRLHNQLVDLKGAIRVFCRVRPLLPDEVAASQKVATECDTLAGAVELVGGRVGGMAKGGGLSGKEKRLRFNFDAVYGGNSRQDAIFEDTAPVVTSVLDGYNVCIFAYGQTGSGKTYTIEGPEGDRGVNYRTLTALFEQVEHRRAEVEYTITVSLLEVYMDTICDLLVVDESAPRPKLEVKNGAYGSYMPGLTEAKVESAAAAWALLRSGTEARHSAQTKMNEHSSRSHCMLCVRVRGQSKLTGDVWRAKLWLVDLAGSERVGKTEASGERLKEAQFINKSLSALGDCIHALATKSAHVPFRNSKLTYVLQDSLSGDSKTLMFVNANPTEENAAETACSLHFAARVRGVELGPAKRHVEAGAEIRELRAEMAALRHEVSSIEEERRRLADKLAAREATAEALSDRLRSQQALLADKEAQLLQEKQNAVSSMLGQPAALAQSPAAAAAKAEGLRPPRPVGVAAKDAAASGPPNAVRRMLAATASTPLRTGLGTPLTMRTSSDASIMNTARRTKAVMQIEQKTLSQSLDTASQGSMSARSLASNSESTRSLADSKAEYLAKFEQFRRSRAEESGRLAPGLASACKTPAPGRASFSLGASRVKTAVKATPLSRRPERTPLRSSNGRQWA